MTPLSLSLVYINHIHIILFTHQIVALTQHYHPSSFLCSFPFDTEYYAASPYFLLSCPLGESSPTHTSKTTSSSSGNSSGSSSNTGSSDSNGNSSHNSGEGVIGGLTIEDADGTVLTLSSQSSTTDLAHPLCVTVSTGDPL